jgi:hypothetical protein
MAGAHSLRKRAVSADNLEEELRLACDSFTASIPGLTLQEVCY